MSVWVNRKSLPLVITLVGLKRSQQELFRFRQPTGSCNISGSFCSPYEECISRREQAYVSEGNASGCIDCAVLLPGKLVVATITSGALSSIYSSSVQLGNLDNSDISDANMA